MSDSLENNLQKILAFAEEGLSTYKIQEQLRLKFRMESSQVEIKAIFLNKPSVYFEFEGKWKMRS